MASTSGGRGGEDGRPPQMMMIDDRRITRAGTMMMLILTKTRISSIASLCLLLSLWKTRDRRRQLGWKTWDSRQ
ncbi:hypothetical protein IGI04_018491 [Brassica rapa subsp. trilocularis]|uniref:Response regulatory domain-containing protein n=1 Tax=Brassica rapa subsp. trilocularis TaxID=1813537 RepID=A0ABQ7MD38_BRACM|nr:hypothetical protein IGI04_018491 [Brassica rapa subsp. trilocularis]